MSAEEELPPERPAPLHSVYLVMALRWGAVNGHWYLHYCGPDMTKAYAMAKAENDYRGGKYATALYGFDTDGTKCELIGYFPSSQEPDDATLPYHNHRKDYFERLGLFLNDAAEGKALLPSVNDHKVLKYQPIACPDAFKEEVKRQKKVYEAMVAADNEAEAIEKATKS